jgi:hypothetical protein
MANNVIPLIKKIGLEDYERATIGLLWIIRDNGPLGYAVLRDKFIFDSEYPLGRREHLMYRVHDMLNQLSTLDLIRIEGLATGSASVVEKLSRQSNDDKVTVRATSRLSNLQKLFKIHLSELTADNTPITAFPVFGKPISKNQQPFSDVFVLMPFTENMRPVFTDHIQPLCQKLDLTCKRGDDFFSAGKIMSEVWSAIYHARVCIADCTGRNPNVFYELGAAHMLGRKTIPIAQSIDDIPFDIRDFRTIIYSYTPQGMIKFEADLVNTLNAVLSTA